MLSASNIHNKINEIETTFYAMCRVLSNVCTKRRLLQAYQQTPIMPYVRDLSCHSLFLATNHHFLYYHQNTQVSPFSSHSSATSCGSVSFVVCVCAGACCVYVYQISGLYKQVTPRYSRFRDWGVKPPLTTTYRQ